MSTATLPALVPHTLPVRSIHVDGVPLRFLRRLDLLRHLERIWARRENPGVVVQPDLAVRAVHCDWSTATIAPPYLQVPLLSEPLGIVDLTQLIQWLKPSHQPTEIAVGLDEACDRLVVYDGICVSRFLVCVPVDISTPHPTDAEWRKILELMSSSDAWVRLPNELIAQVLQGVKLTGDEVTLRVSPHGTSIDVGLRVADTHTWEFEGLRDSREYALELQSNTVYRIFSHLKTEDEVWITVTGPNSLVGLCVPTPRGRYSYLINPLNE